jgi:hypothetical protein
MFCPFKMANPRNKEDRDGLLDQKYARCERGNCELWNTRFGRCSLAVDAYLKGQADMRAERGVKD